MPGGIVCSVALCKNNSKKAKEAGEKISFFSFPKDIKIQKEWIRKCYRKDKWDITNKKICSKHFKPDDFEDELQAKLMNTQPKQLKKGGKLLFFTKIEGNKLLFFLVTPSLFLIPHKKTQEETERSQRMKRKEDKKLVEQLIAHPKSGEPLDEPLDELKHELENIDFTQIPSSSKESEVDILHRKLAEQHEEILELKQKIEEHEKSQLLLQQQISTLENHIKKDNIEFEDKVKLVFKDFLTSNQVEIALKKKLRARWTQEELSKAFTLRYFSKRAYIYLRNTLNYPLPGLSTLQQWAANLSLTNGILEDVLGIMETAGKTKKQLFKATVLSYDEVKVSSLYEYFQKDDEVFGPYSYMQVIMARGLFSNWKQPVYIGFDQKMTRDLLEKVISHLHKINYNVVACTSDCGGGNQGLWKAVGVNDQNTQMEHPITKKTIFFFADAPHLLKLLRNWFLDTGFVLGDKTIINKNVVQILIEHTRSEINACYKLTPQHLSCEKAQRQNVKLASQLFSNTTATALKHYLPGDDEMTAINTSDFIQLVNDWFDIMNSYSPSCSIPSKRPYGTDIEKQDEVLNKMLTMISEMVCVGKKSLQAFQKGIIMSIRSLQSLLVAMKEEYNISYILTHRLNQDCLENFFCQIRTRGGLHDHPSPLNAIYRIRMILLGKNPGIVTTHSNIESSPELKNEEYLMASALKQACVGNIEIVQEKSECQLLEDDRDTDSSTSSSSIYSTTRAISEKDGLQYIAGYLAKKHKEKYPLLGTYTYETKEAINMHSYSHYPSWIQNLSFGGLIQPSEEWLRQVNKMDKYFVKLHKDTFSYKKDVVEKTTEYVAGKVPDIQKELVKSFCRQRIFVRIRYLNFTKEVNKSEKRKTSDLGRKISKKMRKTVN